MSLQVVTAPEPDGSLVTLAQAKAQCRVDDCFTDDDDLIGGLVLAASAMVEGRVQRRYIAQTLKWIRMDWHDRMVLPVAGPDNGETMAITGVEYVDLTGATQTLDPSFYWDRPEGRSRALVRRWFVIWPWLGDGAERVAITFTVGGELAAVPANVQRAVLLLVSHLYQNRDAVVGVENRDSSTPLPLGVDALLYDQIWS